MNFRVRQVRGGPAPHGWLGRVLTAAAFLAVAWFYGWTVWSANGFSADAAFDYHNQLAAGFSHGHLHLDEEPDPRLIALKDPYDPAQNGALRMPDATYFRGHYYLYFGAGPTIALLLPYSVLTAHKLPGGVAVLIFCLIGFTAASGLWLAVRRRYFPASSFWMGAMGVLVLGLGTHVLALARRPQMWELSIAGAYAGIMLALACLYWALHSRRTVWALVFAGLSLGFAVASRPTCLLAGTMFLPVLWHLWLRRSSTRDRCRNFFAVAGALGVVVAAVLLYNQVRFGSPLEFGQNYQLTSSNETHNRHFGTDYFWHNLRLYYFFRVNWSWELPFIGSRPLPPGPPGYGGGEELYGLAVLFPVLWLAFAAPLAWITHRAAERKSLGTIIAAIGAAFLSQSAFMLCFFAANERYEVDFVPLLGLLAACGLLGLELWAQGWKWNVFFGPLAAAAGIATALAGVLISFDYHGRSISRTAPVAWSRMVDTTHLLLQGIHGVPDDFLQKDRASWTLTGPLPKGPGRRWPIVTSGRAGRGDALMLEYLRPGFGRMVYQHQGAAELYSGEIEFATHGSATIEVEHEPRWPWSQPEAGSRPLTVWIDGRFAWDTVVPVYECRPEELFLARDGIGAGNCEKEARGWTVLPAAVRPPPGGILRLRLVLPSVGPGVTEPLLVLGTTGSADLIGLRFLGGDEWQICLDHWAAPMIEGRRLRLKRDQVQVVEISMPSCLKSSFGAKTAGEVGIRVNGQEALRQTSECWGFYTGQVVVGRNDAGGTSCGPVFTGRMLDAHWHEPGEGGAR